MVFAKLSLFAIASAIIGSVNAFASPESVNIVSRQMVKCFKIPENAPESYSLTAVVVLRNGSADLVAINFRKPPSDWEMMAAPLVADAITQCEPYRSISERIEFAVTPELLKVGTNN